MTTRAARLTAAEAAVLDATLPPGLTEDMRDVALCLYEAAALEDERAGQDQPAGEWLASLRQLARLAAIQLHRLAREKGGRTVYLARGLVAHLSARDCEMCAKFRGNNYGELANEYNLTEMRVRQIVDTWQREQFLRRQGNLPGLDPEL